MAFIAFDIEICYNERLVFDNIFPLHYTNDLFIGSGALLNYQNENAHFSCASMRGKTLSFFRVFRVLQCWFTPFPIEMMWQTVRLLCFLSVMSYSWCNCHPKQWTRICSSKVSDETRLSRFRWPWNWINFFFKLTQSNNNHFILILLTS